MTSDLDDYAEALLDYCTSHSEDALYRASLISRRFINDGFGPDDIVAIHFGAVQQVTANPALNATERIRVLNDAHQFLLEVMIGYGAQYQQFLELSLAELTRRADEAERSEREKLELLAIIAHELGNPLTVALTNMQIAARYLDSRNFEQLREVVSESRDALERLAHLTRQIVSASRSDGEGLQVEPVDLREILTQATSWAQHAASSKGVALNVPGDGKPVVVPGDREALSSLVDNLLSNAIRYTQHGGEVTVRYGAAGDSAWVEIADTGIGMTPDELGNIFNKFYRGERARALAAGGLGMGLHIVQQVASQHGGTVEARSEPGEGSTFHVQLPLVRNGVSSNGQR